LEEHENFNIELQESSGVAIAILHGRRCLHDGPAAPLVFNATDRTCGPDRMGII